MREIIWLRHESKLFVQSQTEVLRARIPTARQTESLKIHEISGNLHENIGNEEELMLLRTIVFLR